MPWFESCEVSDSMMSFAKASLLAFLPILALAHPGAHLFPNALDKRVLTPDNSCGGTTNGYTCNPTAPQGGPCCSSSGFCGMIHTSLVLHQSPLTLSQEVPLHTVVLVVNGTSPLQAQDVLPLQPIPAVAAVASHAIPTALMVDLVAHHLGSVVSLCTFLYCTLKAYP